MPTFDVPEKVLVASENILLRDLLESPTFCYWAISAISNALQAGRCNCEELNEDDEFLQFKVSKIFNAIPVETKRACYKETATQVNNNKNARAETAQRLSQCRVIG